MIFGERRQAIAADARLLVFGFDDRDLPRGDFTQGRDDFLVVRLDQWRCALEQLFGPACRSQYQFESIWNLFKAIFYSYSRHGVLIFRPRAAVVNEGVEVRARDQKTNSRR